MVLDALEGRISAFKGKHMDTLPELLQVNRQGLNRIERDIERLNEELRSQSEREGYLRSQLANVSPYLEDKQKDTHSVVGAQGTVALLEEPVLRTSIRMLLKPKAEIARLEAQQGDTIREEPLRPEEVR